MTAGDDRTAGTDDAPREIDLLAPWGATQRLGPDDRAALERMLAADPELSRRLEVAADERDETIALNEALPTPSRAGLDRLFERIEAHEAKRAPKSAGVMGWLPRTLAGLSPGRLTLAASAAALVIALQAGLLAGAYLGGAGGGAYQTASDGTAPVAAGATALVAFQPDATAADVARLLSDAKAEIIGGPKPGGVFVVRLSSGAMGAEEVEAALKRFREAPRVVRFATPSGGG